MTHTDLKRSNRQTHGHAGHTSPSPTWVSHQAMLSRVRYPHRDSGKKYVLRGIDVDPRWRTFENFLADMGERPPGTTLDRIDNDKGYWPGNCRWATPREQARNTRRSRLTLETATAVAVERLNGKPCREIAAKYGISESLPREIVRGSCWPDALAQARLIVEADNGTT